MPNDVLGFQTFEINSPFYGMSTVADLFWVKREETTGERKASRPGKQTNPLPSHLKVWIFHWSVCGKGVICCNPFTKLNRCIGLETYNSLKPIFQWCISVSHFIIFEQLTFTFIFKTVVLCFYLHPGCQKKNQRSLVILKMGHFSRKPFRVLDAFGCSGQFVCSLKLLALIMNPLLPWLNAGFGMLAAGNVSSLVAIFQMSPWNCWSLLPKYDYRSHRLENKGLGCL